MAEPFQNCAVADVAQGACFVIISGDICCMTRVICPSKAVAGVFHSSGIANSVAEPQFPMCVNWGKANPTPS